MERQKRLGNDSKNFVGFRRAAVLMVESHDRCGQGCHTNRVHGLGAKGARASGRCGAVCLAAPDEQQMIIELQMNAAPPQTRQFRFKQFRNAWKQVIDVADLPPEARN